MAIVYDSKGHIETQSATSVPNVTNFTACIWYRDTTTSRANSFIFSQANAKKPDDAGNAWIIGLAGGTEVQAWVNGTSVVSVDAVGRNTWIHVALVVNNGVLSLYVNGVLQGNNGGTVQVPNVILPIRVSGRDGSDKDVDFVGDTKDARLYSRSLTQKEIQAIVSSNGRDGLIGGRYFHMPMNETSQGTVNSLDAKDYGIFKNSMIASIGTGVNTWVSSLEQYNRRRV